LLLKLVTEQKYFRSNPEAIERSTRFIEDGVRELLKARRVLCGSYAYGYYLEDDGYNKHIFEFMQVQQFLQKPPLQPNLYNV